MFEDPALRDEPINPNVPNVDDYEWVQNISKSWSFDQNTSIKRLSLSVTVAILIPTSVRLQAFASHLHEGKPSLSLCNLDKN